MDRVYDMVIIGGGPGGYTAALYAARAGMDVVVLERLSAGGQMALTDRLDNYPGFEEGIDGFSLAEKMQRSAEKFGAETEIADVTAVDLGVTPKRIESSEGVFYGKTVAISTGAEPRELGLDMEAELIGRGVNYCASCDGMFYKGRTVAVIGGGNSAVSDALILSRIAERVIMIHRRDSLRADRVYNDPLMKAGNIDFRWNSAVRELQFDESLTGVVVEDVVTGETGIVSCDGIFVSIGRNPASELVKGQLELDERGYIIADESTQTNVPGVFAVGDVRTKALRQVVTAVADGAVAVHYAEEYLAAYHSA